MIVGQMLAHIDCLDESIGRLSVEIEQRIAPFAAQRDVLLTIPGVQQRVAAKHRSYVDAAPGWQIIAYSIGAG